MTFAQETSAQEPIETPTVPADSPSDIEQSTPETEPTKPKIILPPPSETAMEDYYKLQQDLLQLTIAFSLVIFGFVWYFYSLNIALSYLLGACTGVVYLRMLARSVGRIGRSNPKSSSGRLAILIGVLVVATQWNQLAVLPVFLGFLTYKAALITFVLWTYALPQPERT